MADLVPPPESASPLPVWVSLTYWSAILQFALTATAAIPLTFFIWFIQGIAVLGDPAPPGERATVTAVFAAYMAVTVALAAVWMLLIRRGRNRARQGDPLPLRRTAALGIGVYGAATLYTVTSAAVTLQPTPMMVWAAVQFGLTVALYTHLPRPRRSHPTRPSPGLPGRRRPGRPHRPRLVRPPGRRLTPRDPCPQIGSPRSHGVGTPA